MSVIGLGSATFNVVDPMLARRGFEPASVRSGSARGARSTTHPLTPHAWATIVKSGVNAGRHGIWDFTERDETGYQLRLVNGSFRRAPAVVLSPLGSAGGDRQACPSPGRPRGGRVAVAGFDAAAREQGLTCPEEAPRRAAQRFGSLEPTTGFRSPTAGSTWTSSGARRRRGRDRHVARGAHEPELLFVVFMAADHIHHLCWTDWEGRRPGEPGRGGLQDPRRGDGGAGRARRRRQQRPRPLRPRGRPERRRQPERLARGGGLPRLRDGRGRRGAQAPRRGSRASPLPAGAAPLRGQAAPARLRRPGYRARRLHRHGLGEDARSPAGPSATWS